MKYFKSALFLGSILLFVITKANKDFDFKEVVLLNKRVGQRMVDRCARIEYKGNRATSTQLPYQVTVRKEFDNGRQWWAVCGGAIVTDLHVITIAHCFSDLPGSLENYRVVAGTTRSNIFLYGDMQQRRTLLEELQSHLETWMTIAACYKHENYRRDLEDINNVAVLKLTNPFIFSDTIKPIRMIADNTFYSVKLTPGSLCLVSGYGAYEMFSMSTFLKMACIPIVDFKQCKKKFYNYLKSNITQMCVGSTKNVERKMKKSTCMGDAGGPLVCQGLLVGVVSYVQGNCYNTPGIYTLLSGYTIAPKILFKQVAGNSNPNFVVIENCTLLFVLLLCNSCI